MGMFFSCPFAEYSDLENGLESIVVKSINFGDDGARTPVRSISFNNRNSDSTIMRSLGSGKMVVEGSISFKSREMGTVISIQPPTPNKAKDSLLSPISIKAKELGLIDSSSGASHESNIMDLDSPKHEAAVKLQKVYKSFRTRRQLADCAVIAEQSWWKLLDFAELKRTSVSFFDIEKHETAISRWSRARTRLAKVGKGLLKNDKAQKLALQHWLEAIDPRHRYGHNLHFYYAKWLECHSKEPFFYWLDIGEGKEVNLDKCPRSKLQQQCIKYLGPTERKEYEVAVKDGKFFKQTGQILDTNGTPKDAKWIFVLSTSKTLYVGKKKKGEFQHSSFLAGGATSAAGRLVVENGILKAVWPHSGHYRPTEENFKEFISYLEENNVDINGVQMSPVDEEEGICGSQISSMHVRSFSSEEDFMQGLGAKDKNAHSLPAMQEDLMEKETATATILPNSLQFCSLSKASELTKVGESLSAVVDDAVPGIDCDSFKQKHSLKCNETSEETLACKQESFVTETNLEAQEHTESNAKSVPTNTFARRVLSLKVQKSFQLGKQLSCKWTTGAGPRIGCVRNYPQELQFQALEQVNLSPRSTECSSIQFLPRSSSGLSPASFDANSQLKTEPSWKNSTS